MNISTGLVKKEQLLNEIERLETDNNYLSHQINALDTDLNRKRKTNQSLVEQLQESRSSFADPASEKKFLENNIDFLENEKKQLNKEYHSLKTRLDKNFIAIDSLLNDLGFIKGEIGTLVEQVGILEEQIPVKLRDAENLDDKITKTCTDAMNALYNNMKKIENKAKLSFYKNTKESEFIRSSVKN
ncbi:MAG: hypothetical protein HQK75_08760 [Candidatus Magnetomorum sp.]|nr:hypothetical protein [Candidatus Magnetomorum sp.]